jgi:hypothetical protein
VTRSVRLLLHSNSGVMVSRLSLSILHKRAPKVLGFQLGAWEAATPTTFVLQSRYSFLQSMSAVKGVGGGGEVFVLAGLQSERILGGEEGPPEVKLRNGSCNSSFRSIESLGEKGGAVAFLPRLEEDILSCGVGEILR